ncbi:MAG TPA: wax ester/triacylglycerol synthase family O-acyltransferase [Ilumatobacter sp.]|nr:wax ester/triacylglycerol synthase family O-acyltransferase [Ilumatobacter sp.]
MNVDTNVKMIPAEPMNGTDATLWDIERDPSLRTTVVSVLQLDRPVKRERLLRSIDESSRLMPRMRQRVVEAPMGIGAPHWMIDEHVDVLDHVKFAELEPPVAFGTVLDLAAACAVEPFDRERPLWECTYVEGLEGGRAALIIKVHHSFTDGVGGVGLLDVFLDASRRPKRRTPDQLPELRAAVSSGSSAPSLADVVEKSTTAQLRLAKTAVGAAVHPFQAISKTVAGGTSAVRLMAPSGAALSPLFTERGPERCLATHDAGLDELHDAAARHGCTINHLFIAGVLDGAAEYHRRRGTRPTELRVTMPISIRRDGDTGGGNQWAPVRFRLPTNIDDPIERMLTIREITGRSRKEPALAFSHSLAGAIQILPSSVSAGVVGGMMRGVDLTVTNVPGLSEPRYLAGAHVERMYPFAPTAGAAFNVALMSHESTACFGIMSDTSAVADPDDLHVAIAAGIDRVLEAAQTRPAARAVVRAEIDHDPKRLSSLDTSFLRVESPDTPMHIGILFVLDGAALRGADGELRLADIRRHISARLGRAPRAMRRLAEVPFGQGRPVWVEDPDFDIAHHVKLAAAAPPGGVDELYAEVCELDMECLDRSRPLWELWLIDHLADGRVGVLQKVHHAMLDGAGFFDFITTLFDDEPLPGPDIPIRTPIAALPSRGRLLADAWTENLRDPFEMARQTARNLVSAPATIATQISEVVTAGLEALGSGARAPETSLNQQVGRQRQLLSVDLRFADIGTIRASLGGTANDVALAVVTGALRSWFEGHHEPLEELQAMCPVSMREPGHAAEWGNRTGAMLIQLPLAEPDPVRRFEIIRERTTRAKARHEGAATVALTDAADHVPATVPGIGGAALRSLIAHQPFINLVITNVPGPRTPVWLMGAEAETIVPIVPLGHNTALGVALASYVDTLTVGLYADPTRCPDLDLLAKAITTELNHLLAAT